MAKEEEAPKPRKSKDRSEKKKRKHAEDDGENHVPSKKSKSAATLETEHRANGESPTKESNHLVPALINGSHDHAANDTTEKISSPSKRRKKSKLSQQANLEDDMSGLLDQEAVPSSTLSKKDLESSPVHSLGSPSSPKSSKKSKINDIEAPPIPTSEQESSALDLPSPMEIDSNQPQPILEATETPYIERSLRSLLSSALTVTEETTAESPFFRQATKLYLPLSPITLSSTLEGACAEHLSPLLLKYYPPLHGVVLGYAHPRFSDSSTETDHESQSLAISVAEYATPMIWLDVDILLFKPARGHVVEGLIVLQTESYIGLQVFNLFSGRIPWKRLPSDWKWMDGEKANRRRAHKGKLKGGRDEEGQNKQQHTEMETENMHDEVGYWANEEGTKVQGVLKFWIWEVDIALGGREAERNLPTIEGTLDKQSILGSDENDAAQGHEAVNGAKRGP